MRRGSLFIHSFITLTTRLLFSFLRSQCLVISKTAAMAFNVRRSTTEWVITSLREQWWNCFLVMPFRGYCCWHSSIYFFALLWSNLVVFMTLMIEFLAQKCRTMLIKLLGRSLKIYDYVHTFWLNHRGDCSVNCYYQDYLFKLTSIFFLSLQVNIINFTLLKWE